MAEVSPLLNPDGTEFTWVIRKPHPGLMQFVIVFPDGDFYVWRIMEFHDVDKIANNMGSIGSLPTEWEATTVAEREAQRLAEEEARRLAEEQLDSDRLAEDVVE